MASTIELLLLAQSLLPNVQVTAFPISVTSAVDASILAFPVAAGVTYAFSANIVYEGNQSAGTAVFTPHSPAASILAGQANHWSSAAGSPSGSQVWNGSFSQVTSPALVSSGMFAFRMDGTAVFSAAGTFSIQAHCGTAGDTFTVAAGSRMTVTPVP